MGENITNLDLYELLDIPEDSNVKEILTAYRKKAVKLHPDKNPDNAAAVEKFIKLSKAVEILTDKAAKISYDRLLKARKSKQKRDAALDSKRKKLKQDLEERERNYRDNVIDEVAEAKRLHELVKRIRADGSRIVEEEKEKLRKQIEQEIIDKETEEANNERSYKLKIRWKCGKMDDSESTYDQETLMELFKQFGNVNNLIISNKKKGLALIEYENYLSAQVASEQMHLGHADNPLRVCWIGAKPNVVVSDAAEKISMDTEADTSTSNVINSRDYESITLMRLRQAEERKRLIEQLTANDE